MLLIRTLRYSNMHKLSGVVSRNLLPSFLNGYENIPRLFAKSSVACQNSRNFPQTTVQRFFSTTWNLTKDSGAASVHAVLVEGRPALKIEWGDSSASHFPFVYIRDNCLCHLCYDNSAKQRTYNSVKEVSGDPGELTNIAAQSVNYDPDHKKVTISWPDGHKSNFDLTWFEERKFPESLEDQQQNTRSFVPRKIPWPDNFLCPEADFQAIIDNDLDCHDWLFNLATHGLTLIKNAPAEPNTLSIIARKVGGFIRKTHYGEIFKVKSKPDPSNIAYSGRETPLHVDLAYYQYQPSIQFLHCIKQTGDTNGGANSFVDGFNVAEFFRKEHPEVFRTLSTLKFTFRDIGTDEYGEFEKKLERPVIGIDDSGRYTNIAYNNFTRSSFLNVQLADVYKLYEAYFMWTKKINEKSEEMVHKLKPGEIWAFDNIRILHSRTTFDVSKEERYVEGMYFDWDEVYSSLRTLRRRLGKNTGDSNCF